MSLILQGSCTLVNYFLLIYALILPIWASLGKYLYIRVESVKLGVIKIIYFWGFEYSFHFFILVGN